MWGITLSIGGLLIITWIIMVIAKNKNKFKFKLYKDFANSHGFEYHLNNESGRDTPQILGEKDNVLFEITEMIKGTRTESRIYTIIRIYNSPFGFDFRISKANFFNKIGNKAGFADILIGNEELDQLLVFKSARESLLKEFMDNNQIQEFLKIADNLDGAFENDTDQFEYAYCGELISPDQWKNFETMLDFTTELVRNEKSQNDSN